MSMGRPRGWIILAALFVLAAYRNFGINHWDELFQTIEPVGVRLGLYAKSVLPWEFTQEIRPWLQIWSYYLVALVTRPFWATETPLFGSFCQILTGLFFLSAWLAFFRRLRPRLHYAPLRWLVLTYFSVPYFAVRNSSESFATSFLMWGFSLAMGAENSLGTWWASGFLLGLSFQSRYQMGVAIGAFALWMIFRYRRQVFARWLVFSSGIVLACALGLGLNRLGYGHWTFSEWAYFKANILEGVASQYGVSPWYAYAGLIADMHGPYVGGFFVAAFLYFCLRYWRHPLTWISLPFVLVHMLIGHKELRFLMPVLAFLPYFAGVFLESVALRLKVIFGQGRGQRRRGRAVFFAAGLLLLAGSSLWGWGTRLLRPTEPKFALLRDLHRRRIDHYSFVYTDIHPMKHGDHSFHFYGIPGESEAKSLSAIWEEVQGRRLKYPHVILSYGTGETPRDVLRLREVCRRIFYDRSVAVQAAIHPYLSVFGSLPDMKYVYEELECPSS